jgi:DNA polymerase I
MARIIRTHETDLEALDDFTRSQVYNGLDVCVTKDVYDAINTQLDEVTERTYTLSRSLQGPVLEMRIRGVLVDQVRKSEVIDELAAVSDLLERRLDRIVLDGVGMDYFNYRSHDDLQSLFYRHLGIPPIIKLGRPTTDRSAREKLETYPIAGQLVRHINALTEIGDRISVLNTAIDPDGRIRTSYNIAGTSTGRFSSSMSEFGTGGNLQNVEESLRSVFIADPGYKFAKADAKSGESYCVGGVEWNRFGDGAYLDACESGDIHTAVARMVWPELGWTGDLRHDKQLALQPFYRDHDYRFMCKKLGHGSNYNGKPFTLAEQSKLDIDIVTQFQLKYFRAFPAHQRWQADVEDRLRRLGYLDTLTGRRRRFFGRRTDPATIREAVAYDPQGSLADIVNTAMIRIWRDCKLNHRPIHIVMHDHDALTFMYPEELEDEVVAYLQRMLVVAVPLANGRELRIPYDVEVGWNKGHFDPVKNPEGLQAYRGPDSRKRQPIRNLVTHLLGAPAKCLPLAGLNRSSPPSSPRPNPSRALLSSAAGRQSPS